MVLTERPKERTRLTALSVAVDKTMVLTGFSSYAQHDNMAIPIALGIVVPDKSDSSIGALHLAEVRVEESNSVLTRLKPPVEWNGHEAIPWF